MYGLRNERRSVVLSLALLFTALLPGVATAQRPGSGPDRGPETVSVRGVLSAVNASAGTLQVVLFDVTTATVRVSASTQVVKGGKQATLADLAAGDFLEIRLDRRSRAATRVEVNAAPTVTITGYLTALDATAGTLQITTGHGTAITLKTTASTRVRLQGRTTTLAGLAVGEIVAASYLLSDKSVQAVEASTPRSLVGTLAGIDLTARTIQYTTLGGVTNTVNVSANTVFRLNGRRVTATTLAAGYPVQISLNLADNSALDVSAVTPALLDLSGTVASLDATAGTLQVSTPYGTAITLKTTVTTTIRLNNASAPLSGLAPGDRVQVSYQLALPPGVSTAQSVTATR
jgi:RNase P/RNase MRP subunit p29